MKRLIVWGAGELGGRVARLWVEQGGNALGYTKTPTRHPVLQAGGIEPRLGNPAGDIEPDDVLLLSIPGHAAQQAAVQTFVDQTSPPPARTVFVSVTGYHAGMHGPVSPDSPPGPDRRSAGIALAEQKFWNWAGGRGVIIRLGGLYCDGRGPFSALARRRGKITRQAPPDKTMALIHYDDAAAAIVAALQHPAPKKVYLGVTLPCPTRAEFYGPGLQEVGSPPAKI